MATIFSDPNRRHRLQQAIMSLRGEGFTLVKQNDFSAELVRQRRRLLIPFTEHIIIAVDEHGRIQRINK